MLAGQVRSEVDAITSPIPDGIRYCVRRWRWRLRLHSDLQNRSSPEVMTSLLNRVIATSPYLLSLPVFSHPTMKHLPLSFLSTRLRVMSHGSRWPRFRREILVFRASKKETVYSTWLNSPGSNDSLLTHSLPRHMSSPNFSLQVRCLISGIVLIGGKKCVNKDPAGVNTHTQ